MRWFKYIWLFAAIAVIVALLYWPMPANAQTGAIDGRVSFAWGDFVADAVVTLAGSAAVLAGYVWRAVPQQYAWMLRMARVDQLLERAIQYGINATAGAARGRVLTIETGNRVVERVLEYAAGHAPMLFNALPIQEWREKILARLELTADSAIAPAHFPADSPIVREPDMTQAQRRAA